jgi:hypothetical protein
MFEVGKDYEDKWGDKVVCNYASEGLCSFTCTRTSLFVFTDRNGYSSTYEELLIVGPWGDLSITDPKVFAERVAARVASVIVAIIEEEIAKHGGGK